MGADIDFRGVRTLLLAGPSLMTLGACSEKDPVCDDLAGLACASVGLQNEYHAAMCDDCGTVWTCTYNERRELEVHPQKWRGCECIDETGCLITDNQSGPSCGDPHGYETYDTGPPSEGECDSD